ncbi:unnamed protein product [Vitrella brassicaformis CCMP3155]|uniref:Uncharacterized protein n=1 Tax=Vitrella brassicaformis (strain CCMP3155) TaxID=1169540 RepID=A0A0G4G7E0_VITBC|nr:unnamed protein product [Vitrella brassicaformis CCMP3155]|eukprot:CEM24480.1 unnamed protein product [Vitrella brassicaformis CCMP3155]
MARQKHYETYISKKLTAEASDPASTARRRIFKKRGVAMEGVPEMPTGRPISRLTRWKQVGRGHRRQQDALDDFASAAGSQTSSVIAPRRPETRTIEEILSAQQQEEGDTEEEEKNHEAEPTIPGTPRSASTGAELVSRRRRGVPSSAASTASEGRPAAAAPGDAPGEDTTHAPADTIKIQLAEPSGAPRPMTPPRAGEEHIAPQRRQSKERTSLEVMRVWMPPADVKVTDGSQGFVQAVSDHWLRYPEAEIPPQAASRVPRLSLPPYAHEQESEALGGLPLSARLQWQTARALQKLHDTCVPRTRERGEMSGVSTGPSTHRRPPSQPRTEREIRETARRVGQQRNLTHQITYGVVVDQLAPGAPKDSIFTPRMISSEQKRLLIEKATRQEFHSKICIDSDPAPTMQDKSVKSLLDRIKKHYKGVHAKDPIRAWRDKPLKLAEWAVFSRAIPVLPQPPSSPRAKKKKRKRRKRRDQLKVEAFDSDSRRKAAARRREQQPAPRACSFLPPIIASPTVMGSSDSSPMNTTHVSLEAPEPTSPARLRGSPGRHGDQRAFSLPNPHASPYAGLMTSASSPKARSGHRPSQASSRGSRDSPPELRRTFARSKTTMPESTQPRSLDRHERPSTSVSGSSRRSSPRRSPLIDPSPTELDHACETDHSREDHRRSFSRRGKLDDFIRRCSQQHEPS